MRAAILIGMLLLSGAALAAEPDPPCGFSPRDWCPAPAGDPCGHHADEAACRADPACYAMPYRGESVVPCDWDERGFASNCPAVGCTAEPPERR